jgi:hypothetical protein
MLEFVDHSNITVTDHYGGGMFLNAHIPLVETNTLLWLNLDHMKCSVLVTGGYSVLAINIGISFQPASHEKSFMET